MNEITPQTIELYSKLLKVPTFKQYEGVVRQLGTDTGYGEFLVELMKQEYEAC